MEREWNFGAFGFNLAECRLGIGRNLPRQMTIHKNTDENTSWQRPNVRYICWMCSKAKVELCHLQPVLFVQNFYNTFWDFSETSNALQRFWKQDTRQFTIYRTRRRFGTIPRLLDFHRQSMKHFRRALYMFPHLLTETQPWFMALIWSVWLMNAAQ